MLKSVLVPNRQTVVIWLSAIYLLFLLSIGKINAMTVLFAYFLESILIGIFNVFKMIWTLKFGKKEQQNKSNSKYGIVLFFIFHYGFFVAIQSIFGFAIFSFDSHTLFKDPSSLLTNYGIILNLPDIKYALPAFVFVHITKFITDFIMAKKYDDFNAQELLFKPYIRIFIQQFVVIISMFFVVLAKAGVFAAALLILIRLGIDLILESIRKNSQVLHYLGNKLANEKSSPEEVKKQLISISE